MKKVFILDDNEEQRILIEEKLKKEGISCFSTGDIDKALKTIANEDFDLLILDVQMPEMDGLTFYYEVRNKIQKNIPTFLLTNLKSTAYQEDIKEYIVKSDISIGDLIEKIKKQLNVS